MDPGQISADTVIKVPQKAVSMRLNSQGLSLASQKSWIPLDFNIKIIVAAEPQVKITNQEKLLKLGKNFSKLHRKVQEAHKKLSTHCAFV